MYNVTLISTEHRESGKCNSDELYKIIEFLDPEVIFEEEVDDERYQKLYTDENYVKSLEVKCVIRYLQNHDTNHIPIDIESNFNFKEWDYMFDTFKKYNVYNQIVEEHCKQRDRDGFTYLNSGKCVDLFDKMKATERQLIEFSGLNKNELLRIHSIFHKKHDNRENDMLLNIYNYSRENQYKQAVFLLGYAHRNSIMKKIKESVTQWEPKINWTFYNNTY